MEFPAYILAAFVVVGAAEAVYLYVTGRGYTLNISVSNISCGVFSLCTKLFYGAGFAVAYSALESRFGISDAFGWQWWSLILTFELVDLIYYVYHRMAHRVALIWGAHIVHHQSDEYNLTVSLRQDSVGVLTALPFYLVPALIGIPLPVFILMNGVFQIYQFLVHTALVGNLGWLEYVISTPRLHRVHHARNAEYIDCNYGGFLLLWDKLFGTYREPTVEPLFGVTEPISSWSPLWANLGYFHELYLKARTRHGWDRLYTFIGPPEWRPAGEAEAVKRPYVTYASQPRSGWMVTALVLFLVSVVLAIVLAVQSKHWNLMSTLTVVFFAAASAVFATRLFDGRKCDSRKSIAHWVV
jgi:sterol desaturase/sphingolipid hydroxylase (fatty acid hydroxylase superfamily)